MFLYLNWLMRLFNDIQRNLFLNYSIHWDLPTMVDSCTRRRNRFCYVSYWGLTTPNKCSILARRRKLISSVRAKLSAKWVSRIHLSHCANWIWCRKQTRNIVWILLIFRCWLNNITYSVGSLRADLWLIENIICRSILVKFTMLENMGPIYGTSKWIRLFHKKEIKLGDLLKFPNLPICLK